MGIQRREEEEWKRRRPPSESPCWRPAISSNEACQNVKPTQRCPPEVSTTNLQASAEIVCDDTNREDKSQQPMQPGFPRLKRSSLSPPAPFTPGPLQASSPLQLVTHRLPLLNGRNPLRHPLRRRGPPFKNGEVNQQSD